MTQKLECKRWLSFLLNLTFMFSICMAPSAGYDQESVAQVNNKQKADVLRTEGDEAFNKSDYKQAESKYEAMLKLYEEVQDKQGEADGLYKLARLYNKLSQYDKASELLEKASKAHEAIGDKKGMGTDLTEIAAMENRRGQYRKSLELSQRALKIHEEVGNKKGIADTLRVMGGAYGNTGKYDKALNYGAESLKIFEEIGDKSGVAASLNNIGAVHWSLGHYTQALEYYQKALKLREEIGDKLGVAASLNNIGVVHYGLGQYTQALDYYQKSLKISEEIGAKRGVAGKLYNIGLVHVNLGHYPEALEYYQKSLKISEEIGAKSGVAASLNSIGVVLANLGQYTEALEYYKRSLKIKEEIGDKLGVAASLNNIGQVYMSLGQYTEALEYHQKALKIKEEIGDKLGVANSHIGIGLVHRYLGHYKEALEYYQKALKIDKEIGDKWGVAASLNNIGGVHLYLGKNTEALEYHQKALKISEEIGDKRGVAYSLNNIGQVHGSLGHYTEALEYHQKSLKIKEGIGDKWGVAWSLYGIGAGHYKRKEMLEAERNLSQAIKVSKQINTPETLWPSLHVKGLVLRDMGRRQEAIQFMKEAVDVVQSIKATIPCGQETEQRFLANKKELFGDLIALLLETGRDKEAFAYLKLSKQTELSELFLEASSKLSDEVEQKLSEEYQTFQYRELALGKLLREEISKAESKQNKTKVENLERMVGELREKFSSFVDAMKKERPELFNSLDIRPIELEKLQKFIPEGVVVLEPVILPDRVVTFVLTNEVLFHKEAKISEAEINKDISDLRRLLESGYKDKSDQEKEQDKEKIRSGLAKLYDLVIKPVEAPIKKARILVVSPTGRLRYIPFQALYDGKRYLIEKYPVVNMTGLGMLEYTSERKSQETSTVAFGNPDGTLKHAEKEVERLKEIVNAKVYVGEKASKGTFRTEARANEYVHLATHGILDNQRPERSYILFSDGRLNYGEIPSIDMRRSKLVVLSACETAVGEKGEGKEIAGLAYQFERAKAGAILATLWAVEDVSTSMLMETFYKQIAKGTNKAEALQKAQLEILKKKEYDHPFYWGPFILIGDWR